MADAGFGMQVLVEAVVACPEPEHSLGPIWLTGSKGQPCCTVGACASACCGIIIEDIIVSQANLQDAARRQEVCGVPRTLRSASAHHRGAGRLPVHHRLTAVD